ncbi:MAG: hypothetical protein J6X53_08920, partial [Abditibacteriota bacterium]|nr:hypothetical protein [Abditibacteriota bacterium]
MSDERRPQKRHSPFLSLLGTILILSLAARTGPGKEFLSYVREMAEEMPYVTDVVESAQDVWHRLIPGSSEETPSPTGNPEDAGSLVDEQSDSGEAVDNHTGSGEAAVIRDTDTPTPEPIPTEIQ